MEAGIVLRLVIDNDKKQRSKKTLNHHELMAKIQAIGSTHLDREQVIIQNLKNIGLL